MNKFLLLALAASVSISVTACREQAVSPDAREGGANAVAGAHGSVAHAPEHAVAAVDAGCTVLESQSWWTDTPEIPVNEMSEHVHTEVCFPAGKVISGLYTFRVVSRLHNVPGWYLRYVRVQAASDQDGNKTLKSLSLRDRRCANTDCAFTNDITVDLSTLAAGEWEFRFHSEIRPGPDSAKANLATTGWTVCVRSCTGRTPQAVPSGQMEGRGWYRDENRIERGYVNARFVDPIPAAPVAGTWCPRLRTTKGSGDEPVTHTFISLDPSFHAAPPVAGRVLVNAAGTIDRRVCIDTKTLVNGRHKLFIRADWKAGPLAGVFVVPFDVANP
jgi:hypothetical protein